MNLEWKLPSEERLEAERAKNGPDDVFGFSDGPEWLGVEPVDDNGTPKLLFSVGNTGQSGVGAPELDAVAVSKLIDFPQRWNSTRRRDRS